MIKLPVLWLGLTVICQAPEPVKEPDLARELKRRADLDQECRNAVIRFMAEHKLVYPLVPASLEPAVAAAYKALDDKWHEVDRDNQAWIKTVLAKHGWPGKSLVGPKGAFRAWLLVQHATDVEFQEACLRKMEAAARGEVESKHLAYLKDRILVTRGKKQIYGTQATYANGKVVLFPIEEEATVDERRKAIGLEPLRDYVKHLEESNKSPASPKPGKADPKPPSRGADGRAPTP